MNRDYLDYLLDICQMIDTIMEFTEDLSFEVFSQDRKTQFAVIRAFEILGEAAKKIPHGIRNTYPDMPWTEMAGMRDKLIHGYFGVDIPMVYKTATEILPDLKQYCKTMVNVEKRKSYETT